MEKLTNRSNVHPVSFLWSRFPEKAGDQSDARELEESKEKFLHTDVV